jgi:hypothetical protein
MGLVNPYCTVEQVREYIRNGSANSTALEDAINAASRWIDQFKGRDYFQHDYSSSPLVIDKWDKCIDDDLLLLPYSPVIELTQVSVAGVVQVAGTDYKAKGCFLVRLGGVWPEAEADADAIKLTGKFGYAQASSASVPTGIPGQITQACIQIAAAVSKHNLKDVVGLDGLKTSLVETDIPRSAKELLGGRAIFV